MSENLAESYLEHEYVVVRGFFPKSLVGEYRAFLEAALQKDVQPVFARYGLDLQTSNLAEHIAYLIAQGRVTDAADKQVLMGQFPLSVRLSGKIHPLARHLGASLLLRQVVGPAPLFMHMPPMMRFVPPRYQPAAVPPHQDVSYNKHMSDFVTVWVPLVPIDHECGGLVMYEGSHRAGVQDVGGDPSGWLAPVAVDAYPRRPLVDIHPGDVVLLSPRIIHGSAPNVSARTRFSMDLRIFCAHARSTKHHMNLDTLEVISA